MDGIHIKAGKDLCHQGKRIHLLFEVIHSTRCIYTRKWNACTSSNAKPQSMVRFDGIHPKALQIFLRKAGVFIRYVSYTRVGWDVSISRCERIHTKVLPSFFQAGNVFIRCGSHTHRRRKVRQMYLFNHQCMHRSTQMYAYHDLNAYTRKATETFFQAVRIFM